MGQKENSNEERKVEVQVKKICRIESEREIVWRDG